MFKIHPQLLADCHILGKLSQCHVLLHRNAAVPWFILVPETDVRELLDVPEPQRSAVLSECSHVSGVIRQFWKIDKMNFAALGNVVPQLHLHLIGRCTDDPCWPKPVWGHLIVSREYTADEIERIREVIRLTGSLLNGDER